MYLKTPNIYRAVRSKNGIIAGVCQGLGERNEIDPMFLRLGFLVSFFFFGTGLLLYIILAFSLPREDKMQQAQNSQILGVCWELSKKTGIEVGIIRAMTLFLAIPSLGSVLICYALIYIILQITSSGNNDKDSFYDDMKQSGLRR